MIKIICDKCKRDCGLNARAISVEVIQNPVPNNPLERGELRLTNSNNFMRFILCQKCYAKLNFPNIYKVQGAGKLDFKDETGVTGQ